MKLPRDVSGAHLAEILCRRWQYAKVHQAGSAIILETFEPTHQRIRFLTMIPSAWGRSYPFCGAWPSTNGSPATRLLQRYRAGILPQMVASARVREYAKDSWSRSFCFIRGFGGSLIRSNGAGKLGSRSRRTRYRIVRLRLLCSTPSPVNATPSGRGYRSTSTCRETGVMREGALFPSTA